jgi:hypothetical protein
MERITTDAPPPVETDSVQVSATPSIPPPVEWVIITIDGGCISEVFNGKTGDQIYFASIDYDVEESGMCPTCYDEYELRPKSFKVAVRNWLFKQFNKYLGKRLDRHHYEYADTYAWCPKCKVNWDDPPTLEGQIKIIQRQWPS